MNRIFIAFASLVIGLANIAECKIKLEVSLSKAVEYALLNNKELKAVKINIDSAKGRLNQSGQLENPVISGEIGSDFITQKEGEYEFEIALSQKFPLTNRLSKEKAIANLDVEMARFEYAQARSELAKQTQLAYVNTLAAKEILKTAKEIVKVSQKITKLTEQALKRGETSQLDASQSRLETATLSIDIDNASIDYETALLNLKMLLGVPENTQLILTSKLEEIEVTQKKFSAYTLENRPDYKLFKLGADSAKAQIELIKAGKYEDIELGIFFARTRGVDIPVGLKNSEDAVGIALSIPLPIKNFDGSIAEQTAMRRKAEALSQAKEFEIKNRIAIYAKRTQKFSQALKKYSSNLESQARKSWELAEESYKKGETSILQVFQSQRNFSSMHSKRIELLRNQNESAINLKYELGTLNTEK